MVRNPCRAAPASRLRLQGIRWREPDGPLSPFRPFSPVLSRTKPQSRASASAERPFVCVNAAGAQPMGTFATPVALRLRKGLRASPSACPRAVRLNHGLVEHCGCLEKKWCPGSESNQRHRHFQCRALPTELPGLEVAPRQKQPGRGQIRSRQAVRSTRGPATRGLPAWTPCAAGLTLRESRPGHRVAWH